MSDLNILLLSQARGNSFSPRDAIVIFARAPVPEQVKTRLAKQLGAEKAAAFYGAMLRDTIELARYATSRQTNCEVVLCYTPEDAFNEGEYSLAPFWTGTKLSQSKGDLGEKFLSCFAHFRIAGAQRIMIIGSDSPDLPPEYINCAFDLLTEFQLVLGPSRDGGFYLTGTNDTAPNALFDGVQWSTRCAHDQVLANADKLQFSRSSSELWLWDDVDTPEDLQRLIKRLKGNAHYAPTHAPHTARWLHSENLL
jgi:rSAM/selenodomain-associated transferase 1